ncbi:uncharacterized protein LY89DRAFT_196620 [Mollisia scopiformis]|uniref:Uncharacterized protein n=1 Tax=Mollisia scopiformis TaxID=149040 RepID=A0A194WYY5_MOLSC|nr:uncharacterized protein LY89DRAFT_196620 [Mollisia scopiformis]KUJ12904.1 hypothetical protein LY89DRAFT_196620 [Mollisia scopiformis]
MLLCAQGVSREMVGEPASLQRSGSRHLVPAGDLDAHKFKEKLVREKARSGLSSSDPRGWDIMDLVQERSPIRMKETDIQESNGGWTDLAQDLNVVVLFANGLEDLIRPTINFIWFLFVKSSMSSPCYSLIDDARPHLEL